MPFNYEDFGPTTDRDGNIVVRPSDRRPGRAPAANADETTRFVSEVMAEIWALKERAFHRQESLATPC